MTKELEPVEALRLHGRYLTVGHVVDALGVKEATVWQWLWKTRNGRQSGRSAFPEPDVKHGAYVQLWKASSIEAFAKATGREVQIR